MAGTSRALERDRDVETIRIGVRVQGCNVGHDPLEREVPMSQSRQVVILDAPRAGCIHAQGRFGLVGGATNARGEPGGVLAGTGRQCDDDHSDDGGRRGNPSREGEPMRDGTPEQRCRCAAGTTLRPGTATHVCTIATRKGLHGPVVRRSGAAAALLGVGPHRRSAVGRRPRDFVTAVPQILSLASRRCISGCTGRSRYHSPRRTRCGRP